MAEIRWIKLFLAMFDDEKIKLIDSMPERDTIHYIWISLLIQVGKNNFNRFIFLNENVPYTEEMLATILSRQINKEMGKAPESFVKNPDKDFIRNRKLSFETVMKLLLSMG